MTKIDKNEGDDKNDEQDNEGDDKEDKKDGDEKEDEVCCCPYT